MKRGKVIGIISGMGPAAGLDLADKIIAQTDADTDQQHVPVALLSFPERIVDRSTYLFDQTKPSPVPALVEIALQLEQVGAVVGGMPCNTAHDPRIFDAIVEALDEQGASMRMVLASSAVYRFRLYHKALERAELEAVMPSADVQKELVNPVIFDPVFGIKAQSQPVTPQARQHLLSAAAHVRERGAQALILGCTEFPLAVPEAEVHGMPTVDPTVLLARALIRETAPEKLRPQPPVANAVEAA